MFSGAVRVTDSWFQSVTVRGKNENRYGCLRADNATNVVSSADLGVSQWFLWMMKRDTSLVVYCLVEQCKSGVCTSGGQ